MNERNGEKLLRKLLSGKIFSLESIVCGMGRKKFSETKGRRRTTRVGRRARSLGKFSPRKKVPSLKIMQIVYSQKGETNFHFPQLFITFNNTFRVPMRFPFLRSASRGREKMKSFNFLLSYSFFFGGGVTIAISLVLREGERRRMFRADGVSLLPIKTCLSSVLS